MEIEVKKDGNIIRFTVDGNIDERGAEELKSRFRELKMASVKEVIFDFTKVTHIGSAGIGKFLLFYKDLATRGGSLKIENVSDTVFNLLRMVKLDTIFTITRNI